MSESNVFANGKSIACKSFEGKSIAAFPDVCYSPPSPKSGWKAVAYANTAKASDTANASKTVFIKGKPVMLKDKSYFSTSTGNEGAAGPKGIASGVKKGKAYFTSWSMDVKVEGYNVCRHTDLMTHNHGSKPANTTVWHYTDKAKKKPPKECFDDCVKIETACGKGVSRCEAKEICGGEKCPTKDRKKEKEIQEKSRKKGNTIAMFHKKFGKKLGDFRTWKQRSCLGVMMLNTCSTPEQINKKIQEIANLKNKLTDMHKQIPNMLKEFIEGLGVESLKKWGDDVVAALLGKGAEKVALKKVPIIGQLDTLADSVENYGNIKEFAKTIERTLPQLEYGLHNLMRDIQNDIDRITMDIKEMENFRDGTMSKDQLLELQKRKAQIDPCLSARKCILEPFSTTKSIASPDRGCCPGQTPHHLVPNSMIQHKRGETDPSLKKICPKYTLNRSPNVCVEGRTQHECTHNEVHQKTADFIRPEFEAGKNDIETAIKKAVTAHQRTFKSSRCNNSRTQPSKVVGCIEKQLREYFKKACPNAGNFKVRSVDGMGKDIKRER